MEKKPTKKGRNFFHQDVKNLLQQISFQTSLISQIYYTISILVKTVHRNQYIFLEELEQDEIIIIQCEKFLNRRDQVFLINRLLFNDSIHEKYSWKKYQSITNKSGPRLEDYATGLVDIRGACAKGIWRLYSKRKIVQRCIFTPPP